MRDAAHHRAPAPSLNQGRSLVARRSPTPFHEPAPLSDGRQRRELLRTEEVSERVRRILRLSGGLRRMTNSTRAYVRGGLGPGLARGHLMRLGLLGLRMRLRSIWGTFCLWASCLRALVVGGWDGGLVNRCCARRARRNAF